MERVQTPPVQDDAAAAVAAMEPPWDARIGPVSLDQERRPPPDPHKRERHILSTFRDLGVEPKIAAALEAAGAVEPFPIQSMALPLGLAGQDVTGQARTGTGKTFAFGVAMLQRMKLPGDGVPQGLVVTPTRELALQVAGDLETAGNSVGARILTVFGGRAYEPQIEGLQAGVDIVVGTPGRLLDLCQQGQLKLSRISVLVLDEADRMLDLGFLPDVERILTLTPDGRQTMLFSATMPGEVVTLSRRYLNRPTHVRAEHGDESQTVPSTAQHVFRTHPLDKPELLARVLQAKDRGRAMVFCHTKRQVDQLASDLTERGFTALAVHGDLGQGQRESALRSFRNGKDGVLVATDVAARGLDVDDVTHVINYACPDDHKDYLHRTGRTGRAGREGVAVTFVDWEDATRWRVINDALELPFAQPAETYSTSDHLYAELGVPPDATGRVASRRPQGDRSRRGGRPRKNTGQESSSRRPPRRRNRQRTRGGEPVQRASVEPHSGAHSVQSAADSAEPSTADAVSGPEASSASAPSASPESTPQQAGQRRRRRRRGQGRRQGRSEAS